MQATDGLLDIIAALDRVDQLCRWERALVDDLDGLSKPAPTPASTTPRLGIDLAEKHEDIRKLFGKFGTRACLANSWDFEDTLQELYLRIAKSNLGASPFDPSRSSFGHYVVLQIRSLVTNTWRRSTQRGRLAPTVAIDAPGIGVHLGSTVDVDGMLDATAAFEKFHDREPEISDAFLEGLTAVEIERSGLASRRVAYAAREGLRRALAG